MTQVELAEPRLKPPSRFEEMFSADRYDRIGHSLGKAYRDVVRGFRGRFENPPDLVAYPESAEDVDIVLSFCADARAAVSHSAAAPASSAGSSPGSRATTRA